MSTALPMVAACALNGADTVWLLLAFVLVLAMLPGLWLFQAGLLRRRNAISIAVQIFATLAALSLLWFTIGFALVFSPTAGGVIGSLRRYALFYGVAYDACDPDLSPTLPIASFALFEMLFAAIAPLLMTGAYAERMPLRASLCVSLLWELIVYYPLAHWMWAPGGWLLQLGALDFAGGVAIHAAAGAGSLVLAHAVGPRAGVARREHAEFEPASVGAATAGALLLWLGWFGFNGGSALVVGRSTLAAVVATHLAASASASVWFALEWWRGGRPKLLPLLNGAVAGLAGITPGAGYVNAPSAVAMGLLLGAISAVAAPVVRQRFKIDDALDVSIVHGLTGVVGTLLVGFFASSSIAPPSLASGAANGIFFGGSGRLLGVQVLAILVALLWSTVGTWAIARIAARLLGPLRVSAADERVGLDAAEHGEVVCRLTDEDRDNVDGEGERALPALSTLASNSSSHLTLDAGGSSNSEQGSPVSASTSVTLNSHQVYGV